MPPSTREVCLVIGFILITSFPALLTGQTWDLGGNASWGWLVSDEGDSSGAGGMGVSAGWPASSTHKIQFDYSFADVVFPFDSHFVTASYVLQKKSSGVRPFFQIGAGVEVQKLDKPPFLPPGLPFDASRTNFALVLGGGAAIDVGRRVFIRPELRSYAVFGPAVFILPMVTVGARF